MRRNLWRCDMTGNPHYPGTAAACNPVNGGTRLDQDRKARSASNGGTEVGATNTRSGGIFPCW